MDFFAFASQNARSEFRGATTMLDHIDWSLDPDWDAIAQNAAHPQHHIVIDRYGTYICRECSTNRLYVLRDDEVQRLLLMDRTNRPEAAQ